MLNLNLLIHPENHKKRKDKQRLQLKGKGQPIEKHGPIWHFPKQIIKAQEDKEHKNNIALSPKGAVRPDGRHNQHQTIGTIALCLTPCSFHYQLSHHCCRHKIQPNMNHLIAGHGIDGQLADYPQNIDKCRCIIISVRSKVGKSHLFQIRNPWPPIHLPVHGCHYTQNPPDS